METAQPMSMHSQTGEEEEEEVQDTLIPFFKMEEMVEVERLSLWLSIQTITGIYLKLGEPMSQIIQVQIDYMTTLEIHATQQ